MIPAAYPVKNHPSHAGFPGRVLVVDDEPLIRWALSVGLAAAGYDTVAAASAAEARRIASMWPHPDVVLLDLHQKNCSELFADLRDTAPGCHIFVLGTCCDGGVDRLWQGLEVIPKPFDLADVVRRVEGVINPTPLTPS